MQNSKIITIIFPKKTSLGGKRIETYITRNCAEPLVEIHGNPDHKLAKLDSAFLTSLKHGNTLILRGYPTFRDPLRSHVLAQNFLHFFPYVGLNILTLKNMLLMCHWIIWGWRLKGIVFQTKTGLDKFRKGTVGKVVCRLYNPTLSVESFYEYEPIELKAEKSIDLLLVSSMLPHKCPDFTVSLARESVRRFSGLKVALTLPPPTNSLVGVDDQIEYLGEVSENYMKRLYGTSKVVVIPSKVESFSLPLHDCLYACVPVISFSRIAPDLTSPFLHLIDFCDTDKCLEIIEKYIE